MKNVTIALDDEVHRQARIRAAELGTSLSALVKEYLTGLVAGEASPASGVREMQSAFKHAMPEPQLQPQPAEGPPWLVDGKWVYTKDGKPRQPGAWRKPGKLADLPEDWDEWPADMLEYFDKLQNEPWDDDPVDMLEFDESQLSKE